MCRFYDQRERDLRNICVILDINLDGRGCPVAASSELQ